MSVESFDDIEGNVEETVCPECDSYNVFFDGCYHCLNCGSNFTGSTKDLCYSWED